MTKRGPEMSAFEDWFKEQYGKREQRISSDVGLKALVEVGLAASAELQRRERWDECRKAALYAWHAWQAQSERIPSALADRIK